MAIQAVIRLGAVHFVCGRLKCICYRRYVPFPVRLTSATTKEYAGVTQSVELGHLAGKSNDNSVFGRFQLSSWSPAARFSSQLAGIVAL